MARHTWHRTPNRNNDADYRTLTAGARCLLRDMDEMLYREEILTANVSTLAGWFGLDRKTTREGIEAIAQTGLLKITKEERGKSGTFYTITDPKRTPNGPQTNPEPTPDQPQTNPEPSPHTSANDAGSSDASLNRIEENRREIEPPLSPKGGRRSGKDDPSPEFLAAWSTYPKREAGDSRPAALKAWNARINQGVDPQALIAGVKRYAAYCDAKGWVGSDRVKMGATFFGPDEWWKLEWGVSSTAPKAAGPSESEVVWPNLAELAAAQRAQREAEKRGTA